MKFVCIMWNKIKPYYFSFLPVPLFFSTFVGMGCAIKRNLNESSHINSFIKFSEMGYAGFLTGIFYPITFPLCGIYIIFTKYRII